MKENSLDVHGGVWVCEGRRGKRVVDQGKEEIWFWESDSPFPVAESPCFSDGAAVRKNQILLLPVIAVPWDLKTHAAWADNTVLCLDLSHSRQPEPCEP